MEADFLPGTVNSETAEALGVFVARWSLAEFTLIMPLLVAMNSHDQAFAASVLSSTNSTEGKIKLVRSAVQNMQHHLDRREPILKSLSIFLKLCEARNALCHHLWVTSISTDQCSTIDHRKPVGNQERITRRSEPTIRDLCNSTVEVALQICSAARSPWLTKDGAAKLMLK